jgi:hypothetical protein
MKLQIFLSMCLGSLLAGCGTTAEVQKSWVEKDIHSKDLHGVLVVAVATSEEGRRAFEEDFTQALNIQGVRAVASYTIKGGTTLEKGDIADMAAEAEVDTALITLFAGRDHSEVLHPGRKYYSYAPVYGRGYYGRGRVYGVPYQVGQTSDFWSQHKSIHLEASLYEVKTEELLWRASSGMEEQSDVDAMRPAFIQSFMEDLARQGLVD